MNNINAKNVFCNLLSFWCDVLNIVAAILMYGERIGPSIRTVSVALILTHTVSIAYLMFSMYLGDRIGFKYHLGVNRMFMLVPDIILTVQAMSTVHFNHREQHMVGGFLAAQVFSWISPFLIIGINCMSDVRFVRAKKTNKNISEMKNAEEVKSKVNNLI